MKRILLTLVFAALLLTPLYPVYAIDTSTNSSELKNKPKLKVEQALTSKIGNKIDKIASREAQLKLKREGLMAKLDRFRDQRKAKLVGNINDILAKINKNRTSAMSRHLDILTDILNRVSTRNSESSASADDKAGVATLIASASASIINAKSSVETQAAKDYTINISTESAAKADTKAARDALKADLDATHSKVKTAAGAVREAIKAYVSIVKGVNNGQ